MSKITIERFLCGQAPTAAAKALAAWLNATQSDRSYLPMMQYRVAGKAAAQCRDLYYIAMQDGKVVSRLWNGWGLHPNAVGNFGNFLTLEKVQGQGIGKKMLDVWYEDLMQQEVLPLGLFCSAKNGFLIDLYARYGFTQAVINPNYSFLFKPLGDCPADFRALTKDYYRPTGSLTVRPATVQWRHEIDCLLKFTLASMGESFGLPGCQSLEESFVWPERGSASILFTEQDRPVGWSFTPAGGQTHWQIHPAFRKMFDESR